MNHLVFPVPGSMSDSGGLTKRELFAAMAMQGIKANDTLCRVCSEVAGRTGATQQEMIAVMAVKDADALLAELYKEEPNAQR